MEEKKASKRCYQVPLLDDKNSDFNGWYSRLKLMLDTKSLWENCCQKPEDVPSATEEPDKFKTHMQRRKQARWKIDKTLSPDLCKTVEEETTPFGVLERLRKMFVGATNLSLVRQLRAVMEMKYVKGTSLLVFIEELKQGFVKLENIGLPLQESLKPYILVMRA
ncbi:hypothetical protein PR002_g4132 [Phytophthora rubi]|uniref:DUF4219 domain-containing protein n=1 Tax=Phytophthora rubi TaxID=129364 RepID=A0A6A3NFC6_9STRA|nr:hypothetical protein PR002_g4132 [Phytophthora rubi]